MNRPTWDDYFFEVVKAVSKRASCNRGRSGCVIVKDNHILVTGYVGAPPGFSHCDEIGHDLEVRFRVDSNTDLSLAEKFSKVALQENYSVHCIRTIHAEENALLQAARQGIALEGSTLYCTMTPCRSCAMRIVRVGILKVFAERKYNRPKESEEIFKRAKIELIHKFNEVVEYPISIKKT
jgi:dCMP deaminase